MANARARAGRRTTMRPKHLLLPAVAVAAGAVVPVALANAPAQAASGAKQTTIDVASNATWGKFLAMDGGWTVYRLTKDKTDKSTCFGGCLKVWPPVLLAKGQTKPRGDGVGHLGTLRRPNGTLQVTYEGIPLYLFVGDVKVGEVTGNGKDKFGTWWVVNPAHPMAVPKPNTGGVTTTTAPGGGVSY
jgi:predicted lipoprotein with Yx(FWY)xxD motif